MLRLEKYVVCYVLFTFCLPVSFLCKLALGFWLSSIVKKNEIIESVIRVLSLLVHFKDYLTAMLLWFVGKVLLGVQ